MGGFPQGQPTATTCPWVLLFLIKLIREGKTLLSYVGASEGHPAEEPHLPDAPPLLSTGLFPTHEEPTKQLFPGGGRQACCQGCRERLAFALAQKALKLWPGAGAVCNRDPPLGRWWGNSEAHSSGFCCAPPPSRQAFPAGAAGLRRGPRECLRCQRGTSVGAKLFVVVGL